MDTDRSLAPLAFLDTETDGVHPGRKVWEIAVVRREPDGTETSMECFVEIDLSTADPFGLRVGRFWDRHPFGRLISTGNDKWIGDALLPHQAAIAVAKFTHGAHIVGAVPNFDTETLDPLLRTNGLVPSWHYHLVDVENLAIGWLAARGTVIAPPYNSKDILELLDLPPVPEDALHTAMGDVRHIVMPIYDLVMGK